MVDCLIIVYVTYAGVCMSSVQFAPTYHEYVLYSNGSQEAPQRNQMRTLVPKGACGEEEMHHMVEQEHLGFSLIHKHHHQQQPLVGAIARARPSMEVGRGRVTTVGRLVAEIALPREGGHPMACNAGGSQHLKPTLLSSSSSGFATTTTPATTTTLVQQPSVSNISNNITTNDFNPRAAPCTFQQWQGGSLLDASNARHQPGTNSHVVEIRRESNSSVDDEATELTKLTDRRASEHGSLMDTIDIRGENEEYSEGFIQR